MRYFVISLFKHAAFQACIRLPSDLHIFLFVLEKNIVYQKSWGRVCIGKVKGDPVQFPIQYL